jgi:hut operon positive regulator
LSVKLCDEQSDKSSTVGRIAMLLALTQTAEEETDLKQKFMDEGYLCAVTGMGGNAKDIKQKINNAVIGASLNNGVIRKTSEEVHAVIHATLEAKEGMMLSAPTGANIAVKIAIARNGNWLAVAIYGSSAMHTITNHERVGLGVMHI